MFRFGSRLGKILSPQIDDEAEDWPLAGVNQIAYYPRKKKAVLSYWAGPPVGQTSRTVHDVVKVTGIALTETDITQDEAWIMVSEGMEDLTVYMEEEDGGKVLTYR